jgi:hypothetical protein
MMEQAPKMMKQGPYFLPGITGMPYSKTPTDFISELHDIISLIVLNIG